MNEQYEITSDEIYIGTDGHVWLHSDLWGCRFSGDISKLFRHDDWSVDIPDGYRDIRSVRILDIARAHRQ